MSRLVIKGGRRLCGTVNVHGAKNAVLPILAATILTKGVCVIHNCPHLSDVAVTMEILKYMGAKVLRTGDTLTIDASGDIKNNIPEELMRKLRSSIVFMGAILARCKSAEISAPGGCELGPRPIDLHIAALKTLGVEISEENGVLNCNGENAACGEVVLNFPSVGATENILLMSCLVPGKTVIKNAAKEPEIVDLAEFLNKMGANVSGAGTDTITITGAEELCGTQYTIMPDRIAAVTYLCCGAVTGGKILLKNVNPEHIASCLEVLEKCGCKIAADTNSIAMRAPRRLKSIDLIRTEPYPGFPTDAQSLFLALLTIADGTSIIEENIFKSRFKAAEALCDMGASVSVSERTAYIEGTRYLRGAHVSAHDLRGGAGLVIAALGAKGITEIESPCYIDRGYENLEENLKKLGAKIVRIND